MSHRCRGNLRSIIVGSQVGLDSILRRFGVVSKLTGVIERRAQVVGLWYADGRQVVVLHVIAQYVGGRGRDDGAWTAGEEGTEVEVSIR